jgi:hypothetical protein
MSSLVEKILEIKLYIDIFIINIIILRSIKWQIV